MEWDGLIEWGRGWETGMVCDCIDMLLMLEYVNLWSLILSVRYVLKGSVDVRVYMLDIPSNCIHIQLCRILEMLMDFLTLMSENDQKR